MRYYGSIGARVQSARCPAPEEDGSVHVAVTAARIMSREARTPAAVSQPARKDYAMSTLYGVSAAGKRTCAEICV